MLDTRPLLLLSLLVSVACAGELRPEDNEDGGPVMVDEQGGPNVGHNNNEEDGTVSTNVDATSEEDWIYLDLDDGQQLDVTDPQADPDWDIAFMRFHIKLNGGASGMAGVEAALLEDVEFDEVDVAPADGYVSDAPDGDDENEHPEYVLQDWYNYNIMTHVLTPAPVVYVVRTAEPRHYKLEIEGYYSEAGTSGHVQFRWGRVDGP